MSVVCEVDANPLPNAFSWALDGAAVLTSDHYYINGSKSVATISPRTPQDYGLLMCWATNALGKQREPCTFRIVPAGIIYISYLIMKRFIMFTTPIGS